jgi:hypothetical protein
MISTESSTNEAELVLQRSKRWASDLNKGGGDWAIRLKRGEERENGALFDDGDGFSPKARGVPLESIQTTRHIVLDAPFWEAEQLLGSRSWAEVTRQEMQTTAKTEERLSR